MARTTLLIPSATKLLRYPEVESWRALMGAFQAIYQKLEQALLQEGCSVSRFQILFHLYFEHSLAASEIASRLCVSRGNISMFLKRMEADALIKRVPSAKSVKRPDFSLTRKGRVFFEEIFPGHIGRVRKFMPPLNSQIIGLLRKIIDTSAKGGAK